MIFHDETRYEQYGEIDRETGNPTVAFEDAVIMQPWDLMPPSSFASENRSRMTMLDEDFQDAARNLAITDRPYINGGEGDDQNSEDESGDERP